MSRYRWVRHASGAVEALCCSALTGLERRSLPAAALRVWRKTVRLCGFSGAQAPRSFESEENPKSRFCVSLSESTRQLAFAMRLDNEL